MRTRLVLPSRLRTCRRKTRKQAGSQRFLRWQLCANCMLRCALALRIGASNLALPFSMMISRMAMGKGEVKNVGCIAIALGDEIRNKRFKGAVPASATRRQTQRTCNPLCIELYLGSRPSEARSAAAPCRTAWSILTRLDTREAARLVTWRGLAHAGERTS